MVEGVNGRVFGDAEGLVRVLEGLLDGEKGEGERERLREGIEGRGTLYAGEKWGSWEEKWEKVVLPLLS